MPILTEDVFGVINKPVLSYIDRPIVDELFTSALKSDKQIIVYGASKQGKSALVSRYLPYENNIVIRLTPKTQITDVYHSILRQLDIRIKSSGTEETGRELSAKTGLKFNAIIPFFVGASATVKGGVKATVGEQKNYQEIPFNPELPQDISELIKLANFKKKVIILENFHYLQEEKQKTFAFDLRTFQELGIRFVILGVWRNKNKLTQYNGDLLDRIQEIPVEPWTSDEFIRVAEKGQAELSIEFSRDILKKASEISFSSIGVFQELLKETCLSADIRSKQQVKITIDNNKYLENAIFKKSQDYTLRHKQALEGIAAGNVGSSSKDSLYLPYYLVRTIINAGYEGIANGMRRSDLQSAIQKMHHKSACDVRPSDMSNLLYNLAILQSNKGIAPPIIDFDKNNRLLQVVDSTFYFFMKTANLQEVLDELPNPRGE